MKMLALLSVGLFAISNLTASAADAYDFDPAHSTISFKIRHLISDTSGRFNDFTGKVVLDEAAPEKSTVEVAIKTDSIDTANEKRDGHLKSPDFFDTAKFPEITFKSKKVKRKGEKSAVVTGDLTMHGVTKEVPVTINFLGKGKGMDGGQVTGWSGSTTLDRKDFGLDWNKAVEGTNIVGDEVKIEIQVEAHAAK